MANLRRLALALGAILPVLAAPAERRAPLSDGKYIVTFKNGVDASSIESHIATVKERGIARRGLDGIDKIWSKAFKGYSGDFDSATLDELLSDDDVRFLHALRRQAHKPS